MIQFVIDTLKDIYRALVRDIGGSSVAFKIFLGILIFLAIGFAVFAVQILFWGLGYTGMNNRMTWAMWIVGDLGLIVLGGGAFFTSFLLYIFRRDEFQPLINSAVLIGFLCYTFTFFFLLFDVGQPLRAWFGYVYPNWGKHLLPQSMMTEVFFCITIYWCILTVEMIPLALKHKIIDNWPILHFVGHYLHHFMWILAAAGTFLSFFHQGSLGGIYGVMFGRPGWYRPHLFFMFIISALAAGPATTVLITYTATKLMKKKSIPFLSFVKLARVSGFMFAVFFTFSLVDIFLMSTKYVPLADRTFLSLWQQPFGIWMLGIELVLCGAPILLNFKKFRFNEKTLVALTASGALGMLMNRLNATLHGFSIPNFPWQHFAGYSPSIQEWFVTFGIFATMAIIYILVAQYFPLFENIERGRPVDIQSLKNIIVKQAAKQAEKFL